MLMKSIACFNICVLRSTNLAAQTSNICHQQLAILLKKFKLVIVVMNHLC